MVLKKLSMVILIILEYFSSFDIKDCSKISRLPNIVFEFKQYENNIEFVMTP